MEERKEYLEEKAKKLLKLNITKNFWKMYFNPFTLESFQENLSAINYLVEKGYIIERGKNVKEFHYEVTSEGKKWARK